MEVTLPAGQGKVCGCRQVFSPQPATRIVTLSNGESSLCAQAAWLVARQAGWRRN